MNKKAFTLIELLVIRTHQTAPIYFFIVLLSTFYVVKLSGLKISGHSSVVERLVANEKVEGSSPFARSIL